VVVVKAKGKVPTQVLKEESKIKKPKGKKAADSLKNKVTKK
jgi:hypothetical protein